MPSDSLVLRVLLLLLAVGCLLPTAVGAQDPGVPADTVYRLVLIDGSSFVGRVESETADRLVFRTLGGVRLEVERSQIRTLEPASGRVVQGEVWAPDPNRTRLFFGPTGRSLSPGEGYVGLFELFFGFAAVGVGDRLVLAGGTPVIPGLIGDVFYLAPKLRVASLGRTDVSVGALTGFVSAELDEGSLGVVYVVGTHGTPDHALTVGLGWGFALTDEDTELSNDPVFMLGMESRRSRRVKLVSESYAALVDGLIVVPSGGVRLLGDWFSADLGIGGFLGSDEAFCCLPILSASYTF